MGLSKKLVIDNTMLLKYASLKGKLYICRLYVVNLIKDQDFVREEGGNRMDTGLEIKFSSLMKT